MLASAVVVDCLRKLVAVAYLVVMAAAEAAAVAQWLAAVVVDSSLTSVVDASVDITPSDVAADFSHA